VKVLLKFITIEKLYLEKGDFQALTRLGSSLNKRKYNLIQAGLTSKRSAFNVLLLHRINQANLMRILSDLHCKEWPHVTVPIGSKSGVFPCLIAQTWTKRARSKKHFML
jgi:hypothetical protein